MRGSEIPRPGPILSTATGGVRCWGARPTGYPADPDDFPSAECESHPMCCTGDDETPRRGGGSGLAYRGLRERLFGAFRPLLVPS